MIQHVFLFHISHVTFQQNQHVSAVFLKGFLSVSVCMRYRSNALERFSEVYEPECIQMIYLPNSMQCPFTLSPPFPPFVLKHFG